MLTIKFYSLNFLKHFTVNKRSLFSSIVEIKIITSLWRAGMVGALSSHHCGLGSIPAQCHKWVEFLVVPCLVPRFFFSGSPVFFPPQKPTSLNSNSNRGQARETAKSHVTPSLVCNAGAGHKFITYSSDWKDKLTWNGFKRSAYTWDQNNISHFEILKSLTLMDKSSRF